MSRMAALLLAASPAPDAPQLTAEQALQKYRSVFKPTHEIDCPKSGDEIVVCARRDGELPPERLPLPLAREPGARIRGEPLADGGGCISRCPQPVMIPLHKIPGFIGRVIERLKED